MRIHRSTLDIDAGGCALPATFWRPQAIKGSVLAIQPSALDLSRDSHWLERVCAQGFAVLASGLLSAEEEASVDVGPSLRFDIEQLAARTIKAVDWILAQRLDAPIAVVAKGTAAAAALLASSKRRVDAIVSIAGRPDLAAAALWRVQTPTLFVAGADNFPSQSFSELAAARMTCWTEVQLIPGDGSLLRPSEAEDVAAAVLRCFSLHLGSRDAAPEHLNP